jgi:hypothetical protein
VPPGTTEPLWGVAAIARDDVWIVGGGAVLHWDGHAVRSTSNIAWRNLLGVSAPSRNVLWAAVGDMARIFRGDGATWRVDFESNGPPLPAYTFDAIAARRADDAWAGGDGESLLHWDGRAWHPQAAGVSGLHVHGIWLDPKSDDGWVVGDNGVILRSVRGRWTPVPSGVSWDLLGVWAHEASDAWIAGAQGILHWDGAKLSRVETGAGAFLHGVWGNTDDVWFVGDDGTVWRRTR